MGELPVKPLMYVRARTPVFDVWCFTPRNAEALRAMVDGVLTAEETYLTFTSGRTSWVLFLGDYLLHRPGQGYSDGMFFAVNKRNFEQSYVEVDDGD